MKGEAQRGLPADRSGVLTEQRNPRTMRLHEMSARELVAALNAEDALVAGAVAAAGAAIAGFIAAIEEDFAEHGGRLIYLGAGTSGRLGVLDASEIPPTFQAPPDRIIGIIAGGDGALRKSSEGKEDDPQGAVEELTRLGLTRRDAVLGIAAGGTTPYVLGALDWCAARGGEERPHTGLLACTPVGERAGLRHRIEVLTGPEALTGSTRMKAGTATKLVLNTISTALMVRSGRVYENLMVDVRASNEKLRDRAARLVSTLTGVGRTEAFGTLEAAGGAVKTAVVMARCRVGREEAERRLAEAKGRLGIALGE